MSSLSTSGHTELTYYSAVVTVSMSSDILVLPAKDGYLKK
jgi:hypothetical protein